MSFEGAAAKAREKKRGGVRVEFHRPEVGEEEARAVAEVIKSGWLTTGEKCAEFEEKFARYVGARPVLADVERGTMNLSVGGAARRVSARTRAIIAVHLAGQPCDMEGIAELARRHGLRVIEDAAHALPAEVVGKRVGSVSEFTCFSFYATKPVTTGEGGMVTTGNESAAKRMRLMRGHGIARGASEGAGVGEVAVGYEVKEAGFKYNLSDMSAAMGIVQLGKCHAMAEARRRIARRYGELLRESEGWDVPVEVAGSRSAWHLYIVRMREGRWRIGRDEVMARMHERGVECSVHFRPLNLHKYYQREFGYKAGDFPVAEGEWRRILSVPIYPGMREEDVEYVGESLRGIEEEFGK